MNTVTTGRAAAVPLTRRSAAVLGVASVAGLVMLCWPLLVRLPEGETLSPPFLFLALLPLVIAVVLAEFSEGGLDPRTLAILGVLSACNAVLRGLSAGTAGVELVFFLLILGGRVFGPGFGFALGCTSLFASALVTAGVGPWLPYQMLVSAWVGMGAGLLPRRVVGAAQTRRRAGGQPPAGRHRAGPKPGSWRRRGELGVAGHVGVHALTPVAPHPIAAQAQIVGSHRPFEARDSADQATPVP